MKYITIILLFSLFSMNIYGQTLKQSIQNNKIPINIKAKQFKALGKQGLYIFKNHVIATRGKLVLRSTEMNVYKNLKTGNIEKIICIGNVVITKQNRIAKANKAIFQYNKNKIILIGNAYVKFNKNTITAYEIIYYPDKGYAVAQSKGKKGFVNVTIYPTKKRKHTVRKEKK